MPIVAQSFGSGSSGNGLLVRAGSTALLIDCGIGPRVLAGNLRPHGVTPQQLSAVFITHEHDDHVRGLASLRKIGVPIRCSVGTARALGLADREHAGMTAGTSIRCGEAEITAIPVSHDAAEPMGYQIRLAGFSICVVTDLGTPNHILADAISVADLIVFEANHDEHMLRSGPYPAHLKRRVSSDLGHLSNRRAGEFLNAALEHNRRPRTIWLAHLSETNNRPALATEEVAKAFGVDSSLHEIVALPRRIPGPIWRPGLVEQTGQLGPVPAHISYNQRSLS